MKNILKVALVAVFGLGLNVKVFVESLKVTDLFNNGLAAATSIKLQAD